MADNAYTLILKGLCTKLISCSTKMTTQTKTYMSSNASWIAQIPIQPIDKDVCILIDVSK